jgi:hypothetical protein
MSRHLFSFRSPNSLSAWLAYSLLLTFFIGGCSGPSGISEGVVRFEDGEPVQSGSVELRSLGGGDRYAGKIDAAGRFTLTDEQGRKRCPPGDYEAVVVQIVWTEDLALDQHQHGRTVPRRFADYYTSDLKVTVKEDQTSPVEILLPDD